MKFFLIIAVITPVIFDYVFSQDYDSLPTVKVITSENPPEETVQITEYACPAETIKQISNLKEAARNIEAPELLYCVFSRPVKDPDDTKCEDEVLPIFLPTLDENHNFVKCGSSENHHLHSFGFYRCGDKTNLDEFNTEEVRENPREKFTGKETIFEVYQVCYDTSTNVTIWTGHKMTKPVVYKTFYAKSEEDIREEISTDDFSIEKTSTRFEEIKKIYDLENKKDPSKRKMLPQSLVPADHFVFRIWKKATNHIINMAPLFEDLIPIMEAIDIGLREAQMRLYTSNPMSHTTLKFYTRVINVNPVQTTESKPPSARQLLQHNIWHKLVYDEIEKKAILIYVHNASRQRAVDKECDNPELCEFDEWSDDPQNIDLLPKYWKNFAYCCPVSKQQIKDIFFFDIEIEGTLKLNSLIIKRAKRKRRNISELFPIPNQENPVVHSENKEKNTRSEPSGGELKKRNTSESSPNDMVIEDPNDKEKNMSSENPDEREKNKTSEAEVVTTASKSPKTG